MANTILRILAKALGTKSNLVRRGGLAAFAAASDPTLDETVAVLNRLAIVAMDIVDLHLVCE